MASDADQRWGKSYFGEKLAAERLQQVYDLAPRAGQALFGGGD